MTPAPDDAARHGPIPDSYIVPGTRLIAGEYPGSRPSTSAAEATAKLAAFLDAGISAFVDLTDPADPLDPYAPALAALSQTRGQETHYQQLTIRDMWICDDTHMRRVLDTIDQHIAEGRTVYTHCWGGIGRTGMVVGCWLVRHGKTGEEALTEVDRLFRSMSPQKVRRHQRTGSPQTEAQRKVVRQWSEPIRIRTPSVRDRYVGAMIGLAAGDALGTTLEFKAPGTFAPIEDMVGGGPFHLAPGQWTDDTSMALCLGESLLERGGYDAADQMRRYVRWWEEGHWSSTGECFDIGNTVRAALAQFKRTGKGFSGSTAENAAGNGSLMRLAPVPLFFASDPELAIRMSGESSKTTHGTAASVDACRYYATLLLGAMNGASKDVLLAPSYSPVEGLWEREPLHPAVAAVARGAFKTKEPPAIRGTGYVVESLEAALWAFARTTDFRSGALAAVNLGDDADTTGAVYGQLAGAYYGVEGIPAEWRERISHAAEIKAMAEGLLEASLRRAAA